MRSGRSGKGVREGGVGCCGEGDDGWGAWEGWWGGARRDGDGEGERGRVMVVWGGGRGRWVWQDIYIFLQFLNLNIF